MEPENLLNWANFKLLSNSALESSINSMINELSERYSSPYISLESKDSIFSTFLRLRSIMFMFESKILKKSIDPKSYTPSKGNQLDVAILLRNMSHMLQPRQEMINQFIHNFWTSCKCSKTCFMKVPFNEALKIYEIYLDLDNSTRSQQVGAIIQNAISESNDQRNSGIRKTYHYRVADILVCKEFFQFVFQVSRSQITRLQECAKKEVSFSLKQKGNHFVPLPT